MEQIINYFGPELWEVCQRLLVAAGIGAVIGIEREVRGHPAGFRTLTVLAVASALIMVLSERVAGGKDFHDTGRIAAQVISGMGFLGAGVIMRSGLTIHGLTTASILWAVAGLGLTAGAGLVAEAILASSLILLVLLVFSPIERKLLRRLKRKKLEVVAEPRQGLVEELADALRSHGHRVDDLVVTDYSKDSWDIKVSVRSTSAGGRIDPAAVLLDVTGVSKVHLEGESE
ncbi:MAG: MgtC/SapB family protein [Planctomycetes bacterium]|nr:MgtC/SapB family protein [Planctomycetota bacterium]